MVFDPAVGAFGPIAILFPAVGHVVTSLVAIRAFFVVAIWSAFGVGKEGGCTVAGFGDAMLLFGDDLIGDPVATKVWRIIAS